MVNFLAMKSQSETRSSLGWSLPARQRTLTLIMPRIVTNSPSVHEPSKAIPRTGVYRLNPNSESRIRETRKKPEIRRPNPGLSVLGRKCSADTFRNSDFRISGFEFLSDLGFRTSDFGLKATPRIAISCWSLMVLVSTMFAAEPAPVPLSPTNHPLAFIDTSFENASPVWYEFEPDGVVLVHLLYDHERSSPNRAAGHIHFQLQARPGSHLTLEFTNLDNVWNGVHGSIARELKTVVISEDGRHWKSVPLESLPENRVRLPVTMPGPSLYVARVEPYRLSDLNRFLADIRSNPMVRIDPIGRTVQGRELEIIRVGDPQAPFRVFLRARAHAWEPGGNWVVEGLVHRLLKGDADAGKFLQRYCVYILPMANKDGVAMGRTRFNLHGRDLNRDWDKPADPELAPENAALERWLERMQQAGQAPHLAMELHNDGSGLLHISRPPVPELPRYLERMARLESLLREHTWFTEGSTKESFHNAGTLGEGWLERYHIDAVIHEFNCNWIAGIKDYPSAKHWQHYGENLATVFFEYFGSMRQ